MKSNRSFILLIAAVVISRIPLLFGGFGADGDGWRVAKSALTLWNEGNYHVSRFPGFPVYEILQAPLVALGGSVGSNISSLIIFIISIIVFRKIILQWNIPNYDLLLVSYAFLPILWKNSALTMDYVWGLCGITICVYLLMNKRILLAGIVLGLAAGTRITQIIYILPFFFFFEKGERKQWLTFASYAIVTAIACYLPVILSANYFFVVHDYLADVRNYSTIKRIGFFFYRFLYSIGLLGWVSITFVLYSKRITITELLRSKYLVVSISAVVTGTIMFGILSDEREYLIPIFPFFLILLAYISSRKQFVVITIALISYGFVSVDLIEHSVANPRLKLNIAKGFLVKEFSDRKEINERRLQLAQTPVPDSSFVMIGMGPLFWLENPYVKLDKTIEKEFRHDCAKSFQGNEVYFIYAFYKPQLDEIRYRGYKVYYWDEMKDYLETFIGYKLEDEKIVPLRTSHQ